MSQVVSLPFSSSCLFITAGTMAKLLFRALLKLPRFCEHPHERHLQFLFSRTLSVFFFFSFSRNYLLGTQSKK